MGIRAIGTMGLLVVDQRQVTFWRGVGKNVSAYFRWQADEGGGNLIIAHFHHEIQTVQRIAGLRLQ